jgi:hypothetical protein
MRIATVTEKQLKNELHARREVLRKLSLLREWGQVPLADAVLMATHADETVAHYLRNRIGPTTPADDSLMLEAALKLAEYHETWSKARPYAKRGEVPGGLMDTLNKLAAEFDAAIARIDEFLSAPA